MAVPTDRATGSVGQGVWKTGEQGQGLWPALAGLAISERDGRGLRLEKYRPFRVRGRLTDAHEGLQGSPARETVETRLASHRAGAKAA